MVLSSICRPKIYKNHTGHIGVGENHFDVPPAGVVVEPVVDVVLQAVGQAGHEGSAGSDAVRVEVSLAGFLRWQVGPLKKRQIQSETFRSSSLGSDLK